MPGDKNFDYGKKIYIHLTDDEGEVEYYELTKRQTTALLSIAQTLGWATRYKDTKQVNISDFADRTIDRLLMPIDFCEKVAECIEENEAVRNALLRAINNTLDNPGSPLTDERANRDLVEGLNPSCNQAVLFGQCISIIQVIDRAITDMLEGIEASTNAAEIANVICNLPILDELGADAVTEFIDLMIEGIQESYAAQYNQTLELDLACDLYCLCKDDCKVTLQRVYDMYLDRVRSQFDTLPEAFVNIGEVLIYFTDAEIDSNVIVSVLHFLFAAGIRLLGGIFGVGATDRVLRVALSFAEPNELWTDCDCVTPSIELVIDETGGLFGDGNTGGTIELLSFNRYRVTFTVSTANTDYRAVFKRADGLQFRLANIAYPAGQPTCQFWQGTPDFFDGCAFNPNNYSGQFVTSMGLTSSAAIAIEFDIVGAI